MLVSAFPSFKVSLLSPRFHRFCRNFIVTELSSLLSNCIKKWQTNSKDVGGDRGRKERQKDKDANTLALFLSRKEWSHTYFLFCSHKVMPQGRSPQASARGNSCPSQYVLNTEIWRHKTTIHLPNTCMVIRSSTLLFLRHMVPTPSDIIPDKADNCSDLVLLFLCCGSHVTFLSMTRFANPAEDISQDRADATACHDLWVVFFLMLLTELRKHVTMSGSPRC